MKLLLSVLFLILFSIPAFTFAVGGIALAAPFLSCDPQEGVTKYRVNVSSIGVISEESDAQPDGSALHDIGNWPVGTYDGTIEAGGQYILDGVPQDVWRWSAPSPFTLTKPSSIEPGGKRIVLP